MFACVARIALDVPAAGSLKAKRQVVRKVVDRLKAKFNVAVAEAEDSESLNRAVVALSVVGNERRHVADMMERMLQFVEDMYVAPIASREVEIIPFSEVFGASSELSQPFAQLMVPRGERSLAEAEGLGAWENRHTKNSPPPSPSAPARKSKEPKAKDVNFDNARAVARSLRNPRDWEKE
jgi:uncharacterized protein YlxP (DUF503 family)